MPSAGAARQTESDQFSSVILYNRLETLPAGKRTRSLSMVDSTLEVQLKSNPVLGQMAASAAPQTLRNQRAGELQFQVETTDDNFPTRFH